MIIQIYHCSDCPSNCELKKEEGGKEPRHICIEDGSILGKGWYEVEYVEKDKP